jgi:hypothetical protein
MRLMCVNAVPESVSKFGCKQQALSRCGDRVRRRGQERIDQQRHQQLHPQREVLADVDADRAELERSDRCDSNRLPYLRGKWRPESTRITT